MEMFNKNGVSELIFTEKNSFVYKIKIKIKYEPVTLVIK